MGTRVAVNRFKDWELRLTRFMASASQMRFKWGAHDCCLFAADGVKAITGVDPALPFRGTYTGSRGAHKIVNQYGGGTVGELVAKVLEDGGFSEIDPLRAMAGDVVLVTGTAVGPAVGICVGSRVVVPRRGLGLERFELITGLRAWRI